MATANPLDQLKDIHLPEAVGFWPPALGWWLLAALLIVLLITGFLFYKHWQKSAYRRRAVQQINHLFNDNNQASHETAAQLNQLLKAVAQQTYSTAQVSRLSTKQWLTFLDNSANMQVFNQGAGQILATAPYEQNSTISNPGELKKYCIQWIRRHR
jgi:Domain of unknown function (DUF4381)